MPLGEFIKRSFFLFFCPELIFSRYLCQIMQQ
jgi:hypothetical protein